MKPAQRPQDCWDWLQPEDVTRFAMLAFARAREESFAPAGQRFKDADGALWSDRKTFALSLCQTFDAMVKAEAHRLGAADYPAESRWMAQFGEGATPAG